MLFNITEPTNSLEWVVFLAEKYSNMFIQGTILTLYIAISGTILGFILGYVVGLIQDIKIRKEDNIAKAAVLKLIKAVCRIYVEIFRGTPMIVQAMIVYYGLRQSGVELSSVARRCRSPGNGAQHRGLHGGDSPGGDQFHRYRAEGRRSGDGNVSAEDNALYRSSAGVPQHTS